MAMCGRGPMTATYDDVPYRNYWNNERMCVL